MCPALLGIVGDNLQKIPRSYSIATFDSLPEARSSCCPCRFILLLLLALLSHGVITRWLLLAAAGVQKLTFSSAAIEEGI